MFLRDGDNLRKVASAIASARPRGAGNLGSAAVRESGATLDTLVEVTVNCPSREVAERIAQAALDARLAAACNIAASLDSTYRWGGKLESTRETPLVMKTREACCAALFALVRRLHPYETPGILARGVTRADPAYEAWVVSETSVPG